MKCIVNILNSAWQVVNLGEKMVYHTSSLELLNFWSRLKSTRVTCHCQVKSSRKWSSRRRSTCGHFSLKSGHVSVPQRLAGLITTSRENHSDHQTNRYLLQSANTAYITRAVRRLCANVWPDVNGTVQFPTVGAMMRVSQRLPRLRVMLQIECLLCCSHR